MELRAVPARPWQGGTLVGLTVAVALAAAIAFGWSTALMHHSASGAPEEVRGLVALLRHVVRQWRWLLGMAASLLGLVLHAVALHLGSLAVVQPLIVTGLVFSFLFRAALDGKWSDARRYMLRDSINDQLIDMIEGRIDKRIVGIF